jgi:hypothetical protein
LKPEGKVDAGYIFTAYAFVFFVGVFVGTNAVDWLDRREHRKKKPRLR